MKCSLDFLYRKKQFNNSNVENTKLARVLGVWDITALGISCTIGSGIYVLTGTVINRLAGPAVILSFVIASIATFLSGLLNILELSLNNIDINKQN
jgi:L-asparagine transporter-like permease